MNMLIFEPGEPGQVYLDWVDADAVPIGTIRYFSTIGFWSWAVTVYQPEKVRGIPVWKEISIAAVPTEHRVAALLLT